MNELPDTAKQILNLDIYIQRQISAGWPESWVQLKWPVGAIRALLLIEAGFARTPSEVASVMKVGRTTVTGMLDRLENDGLITRAIDPTDRRSFVIELTEAGHDLVRQIDNLRRDQFARALARMDQAEQDALLRGLTALSSALALDRTEVNREQQTVEEGSNS